MREVSDIEEQHSAGPQSIGFDYQFYYFMWLILDLKPGQKIGLEVKDDVHIDKDDSSTSLYQLKHTVLKKADGGFENLTTLDVDLWKTLGLWADIVKASDDVLKTHSFHLVTNKNEEGNKLISALASCKSGQGIKIVFDLLKELKEKSTSTQIKGYIQNVLSLEGKAELFFEKLTIATSYDDILEKIKGRIYEKILNHGLVEPIFDSLYSNLQAAKYLDIKDRKKFEISFTDFAQRFGRCFRVASEIRPLPKRNLPLNFPENLENQIFVKQLIEIGELQPNSPKIIEYTSQMLQALNTLSYWLDEGYVLPLEMEEFHKNSILIWQNEFRSQYRNIERQIKSGLTIDELEDEIQNLGVGLIDFIRRKDLQIILRTLDIEFCNGHYYALSDKPEIGWHFDWERKYKAV